MPTLHKIAWGFLTAKGSGLLPIDDQHSRQPTVVVGGTFFLLLETGDKLLLETGDKLVLE